MLLDDLASQREWLQSATVPPPMLQAEPATIPPCGGTSRRAGKDRIAQLEQVARRNLVAAEEARRVVFEQHQRLQEEAATRAEAMRQVAALTRDVARMRDEDDQRIGQMRARLMREARAAVGRELAETAAELDRLHDALGNQDALRQESRDRLHTELETSARLRAEVEQAEAARRVAERALEHASFNVRALGDGGDRSAAPALAEAHAELTEVRAELDEVRAERDRLSAQLEEAHGRVREAERALGRLRRQARDEAAALRAGLERALATTQGDDLVPRRR